ncbi:MAG: hypothetical protein PVI75_02750 [Gammaproteobacteria bacterium]|jgi:hypothetical protein
MNKKKIIFRVIPSVIITLLLLFVFIQTVFILDFGNKRCDIISRWVSKDKQVEAFDLMHKFITGMRKKQYKKLEGLVDPEKIKRGVLVKFANYFNSNVPRIEPKKVTLVGYHYTKRIGKPIVNINVSFMYEYTKNVFLLNLYYIKHMESSKIAGFHFYGLTQPLDKLCKVSFKHLSKKRVFMLAMCTIMPLIVLFALLVCINTNISKRKWLWILFILFGFVVVRFNWTTQEFLVTPIGFQLFAFEWSRASCYAPLILGFSFPVGAVIFLLKRFLG